MKEQKEGGIALFGDQKIRRVLVDGEWWFSVVDVCGVLTESLDSGAYWRKLKQRLMEEGSQSVTNCHGLKSEENDQLFTICKQLKLIASDGKKYSTDCANTEGIFRTKCNELKDESKILVIDNLSITKISC